MVPALKCFTVNSNSIDLRDRCAPWEMPRGAAGFVLSGSACPFRKSPCLFVAVPLAVSLAVSKVPTVMWINFFAERIRQGAIPVCPWSVPCRWTAWEGWCRKVSSWLQAKNGLGDCKSESRHVYTFHYIPLHSITFHQTGASYFGMWRLEIKSLPGHCKVLPSLLGRCFWRLCTCTRCWEPAFQEAKQAMPMKFLEPWI